jgi:conjugative relaxase-like TrwC/TraI family protein
MLIISRPLSTGQVRTYHAEEFANARENSFSSGDRTYGQWHGHLARHWGLSGDVQAEHVWRLADGCDPHTGTPLVRHQFKRPYLNARGQRVTPMAHRAGWDATLKAPKSVSLTALVGGDARVRQAHHDSVAVAVDELERDVRSLSRAGAETTRNWVAAMFEHDSARPVAGYAAPQLHTHVVFFNLTRATDGKIRPLEAFHVLRSQPYITAVYRSELAARLRTLGYDIERGRSGQPEIRGYTAEYLLASSPRSQQIQEQLARLHLTSAEAGRIAGSLTREPKLYLSDGRERLLMQRRHQQLALAFGDQPRRVVHAAHVRARRIEPRSPGIIAHAAVTLAMDRNLERHALADERAVLQAALQHSMGKVTFGAIKADFERRVEAGEFVEVDQKRDLPRRAVTTREMVALERDAIRIMQKGQRSEDPLAGHRTRVFIHSAYAHLSERQQQALHHVLGSGDQIMALEGIASGDVSTVSAAVRDAAEKEGYRVQEFAPITADPSDGQRRLYVLEEHYLASASRMHAFFHRLGPDDRVLLVHAARETRGHHVAGAGRLYQELQEGGMKTIRLDGSVHQAERRPALEQSKERRPERQHSFGLGLGLG